MEKISEYKIKYSCNNVILLGDLNVIFNDSEKLNRMYTTSEKRIGKVISSLFRESNLKDIWSDSGRFTWRRANTDTFSTLDRLLYRSEYLIPVKVETDWSLGFSDHAAVKVLFQARNNNKKSRRIRTPKLDPSILEKK